MHISTFRSFQTSQLHKNQLNYLHEKTFKDPLLNYINLTIEIRKVLKEGRCNSKLQCNVKKAANKKSKLLEIILLIFTKQVYTKAANANGFILGFKCELFEKSFEIFKIKYFKLIF